MIKTFNAIYKTLSLILVVAGSFLMGKWGKAGAQTTALNNKTQEEPQQTTPLMVHNSDKETGDPALRAKIIKSSADLLRAEGDLGSAIQGYARALSLPFDDNRLRARILLSLADSYAGIGQMQHACSEYETALSLNFEDNRLKSYLYNNLASAQKKLSQYSDAIGNFNKGLQLTHNFDRIKGALFTGLAETLFLSGDNEASIKNYRKALSIMELDEANRDAALDGLKTAYEIKASALEKESSQLILEKRYASALEKLESILTMEEISSSIKEKTKKAIVNTLILEGNDLFLNETFKNSALSYEKAIQTGVATENQKAFIYNRLAQIEAKNGNIDKALEISAKLKSNPLDKETHFLVEKTQKELLSLKAEEYLSKATNASTPDSALKLFEEVKNFESALTEKQKSALAEGIKKASNIKSAKLFEDAAIAENSKLLEKAVLLYQEGLLISSEDFKSIRLTLGDLFLQKEEFNEAIDSYLKALGSPDSLLNAAAHLKLGDLYTFQNDFEKANAHYTEALKVNTENNKMRVLTYLHAGKTLCLQNKYIAALDSFEQAERIAFNDKGLKEEIEQYLNLTKKKKSELLTNLGSSLYKEAQGVEEVKIVPEVKVVPTKNEPITTPADLIKKGKFDLAFEEFKQNGILNTYPESIAKTEPVVRKSLSLEEELAELMKKGEQKAYETLIQKVLIQEKDLKKKAEHLYSFGSLLVKNNKKEEAAPVFERALRIKFRNDALRVKILSTLSGVKNDLGKHDEAIQFASTALRLVQEQSPLKSSICLNMAHALYAKKLYAKAESYAEEGLTIKTTDRRLQGALQTVLADSFLQLGKVDKAATYYKTATLLVENKENQGHIHRNLAICLEKLGDLTSALEQTRLAISLAPSSELASLYKQMGLTLFKQGNTEESAKFYSMSREMELKENSEQNSIALAE